MATKRGERRRPRAAFTRVLERLCTRLDARAVQELDPSAERYARPTDAIPLRAEQFTSSMDPDEVVTLQANQVVAWSFVPLDWSLNLGALQPDEIRLQKYIDRRSGAKTRQLAPLLMSHLRDHDPCGTWRHSSRRGVEFRRGGADVLVGQTELHLSRLDKLECSALVVVPHISKRGPNGLWIIARGERHPLELAFRDRFAYHLREDGYPTVELESDDWREAELIELFRSRKAAEALAKELQIAFQSDFKVERVVGHDLLDLIARADTIELDGERFAITAENLERDPVVSPDDLRKALPRAAKSLLP
jgi:hypothetical protein